MHYEPTQERYNQRGLRPPHSFGSGRFTFHECARTRPAPGLACTTRNDGDQANQLRLGRVIERAHS